jgi:hypothetical protein
MLPVAGKLPIEPESETATREPFPLPMHPVNSLANRGAMRLRRSQNFSNKRSTIASGSSCVLRGSKLLCEAQIAGYIDARSDG